MKTITGKIVNYNESLYGEITFNKKIVKIKKIKNFNDENIIIPGFVDLHCHGANGFDTMDGAESIIEMAKYHLSSGTTTLLATTITNTLNKTIQALKGFNDLLLNKNSNIFGVHLEGPFISSKKLGAQPSLNQEPNINFIKKILKIAKIKVVTFAPELKNSKKLVKFLYENNIKPQVGHSQADYNTCAYFLNKYNLGFTHLFNAMSGVDSRDPGVLTVALSGAKYAEIICDLHHVNQYSIKLAKKCISNLYAISDSTIATGKPDGEYKFGGKIVVKKNGTIKIKNSNILAGSVVNMHQTFKNLININFSLNEAVALTSYNASQYINEYNIGKISVANLANFIVLDKGLEIKEIYLNGQLVDKI
ncbi:MAG: N-acetylglucosamine-6-phosphate deacetylase [Alphaproteobacteria bacterium MarineAlpha5_Bin9]|nr:MAG: N-acetylglucosamine-6-phosphate deacetylase [Alphaproteobacteria bacterium MarineAlpha5_Bin9]